MYDNFQSNLLTMTNDFKSENDKNQGFNKNADYQHCLYIIITLSPL